MRNGTGELDLSRSKIVILIGVFGRGGCERQAFLLARDLRGRHALNAEVWALKYDGSYRKVFEDAGIPTRVLGFRAPVSPCICCGSTSPRWMRGLKWLTRLLRVRRELKEGGVEILLPLTTSPNVVAGLTYRFAGVRACIWGERHCGGERVPSLEKMAARQYRRFAANSTAGVEFLMREMGVSSESISFIPNGVEEPKTDARNDWRGRLGVKPAQPLLVKVANLHDNKDHATLLRAWKIVQDGWSGKDRPFLALAGSFGSAYETCQRIVEENGLDSTVRFLGSITDVPDLVRAADMAVFSSPHEGMPNGVLECMAAGKAVVASDLPGIRDALGPDCANVLFPVGNERRCAELILELLHDPAARIAIGQANLNRIRSEFSVQRMADSYLEEVEKHLSTSAISKQKRRPAAAERQTRGSSTGRASPQAIAVPSTSESHEL